MNARDKISELLVCDADQHDRIPAVDQRCDAETGRRGDARRRIDVRRGRRREWPITCRDQGYECDSDRVARAEPSPRFNSEAEDEDQDRDDREVRYNDLVSRIEIENLLPVSPRLRVSPSLLFRHSQPSRLYHSIVSRSPASSSMRGL